MSTGSASVVQTSTMLQPVWAKQLNRRNVEAAIRLFVEPGQIVELRAVEVSTPQWRQVRTESGFYDSSSLDRFAADAVGISPFAAAVYYTINPVHPDLFARSANRIKKAASGSLTTDANIVRRRFFYADFDPKRLTGISSTEVEKARAGARAAEVRAYLLENGFGYPISADSGNGFHEHYAIDLPADDGGLIKMLLQALAEKFSDNEVDVDTSVFNPSRICKAYGTAARKGDHTPDRPHREAKILHVPDRIEVVSRETIEAVTAKLSPPKPKLVQVPAQVEPTKRGIAKGRGRGGDISKRAKGLLDRIEAAVEGSHGSNPTFKAACAMNALGVSVEQALQYLLDYYNPRCQPPWSEPELRHKVKDAFTKNVGEHGKLLNEDRQVYVSPSQVPAKLKVVHHEDQEASSNRRPLKEDDDPHRLARLFLGREFHHEHGHTLVWHRNEFCRWDGSKYRPYLDVPTDLTGSIEDEFNRLNLEQIQLLIEKFQEKGVKYDTSDLPKAKKVTTAVVKNAMQALQSEASVESDVDAPAWIGEDDGQPLPDPSQILPASNGLVDLTTLKIMPLTPRFYCPFAVPYAYDPNPPEPLLWMNFLNDLFPDDPEAIRELRKWMGYLLSIDKSQEKALLVIGPKRSGKGTLITVMEAMIGRENTTATTFKDLSNRFGLWPLLGKAAAFIPDARFSGAGENNDQLIERLLSITSRDPVAVDMKFLKPISVRLPTRLIVFSNETPNLRENSGALPGRFSPLKLTQTFFGREDTELAEKLVGEIAGITRWAIEGRNMLKEDGRFIVPKSAATIHEALRQLSSPMVAFVEECCDVNLLDHRVPRDLDTIRDIHFAYQWWCRLTKREAANENIFGRTLIAAFPHIENERPRDEDGTRLRRYRGISLSAEGREMRRKMLDWIEGNRSGPHSVRNGPQY